MALLKLSYVAPELQHSFETELLGSFEIELQGPFETELQGPFVFLPLGKRGVLMQILWGIGTKLRGFLDVQVSL